jgi:hypothetical protein
MAREDEIRIIAYTIWEEEGCPNGRDCEHWSRAEAVWEQKQKPALKNTVTEPKLKGKKNSKVTAAKKRSRKN